MLYVRGGGCNEALFHSDASRAFQNPGSKSVLVLLLSFSAGFCKAQPFTRFAFEEYNIIVKHKVTFFFE